MITNGLLEVMPKFDVSNHFKMIHHYILVKLFSDDRWRVPVPTAWGMPHVLHEFQYITNEQIKDCKKLLILIEKEYYNE